MCVTIIILEKFRMVIYYISINHWKAAQNYGCTKSMTWQTGGWQLVVRWLTAGYQVVDSWLSGGFHSGEQPFQSLPCMSVSEIVKSVNPWLSVWGVIPTQHSPALYCTTHPLESRRLLASASCLLLVSSLRFSTSLQWVAFMHSWSQA